jgi:hypothetical protein
MIYIDFKNIDIMGVADGGSGGGTDLSNYYTKSEVDSKLVTKADKTEITNLDKKIGDINTVLDSINGEII